MGLIDINKSSCRIVGLLESVEQLTELEFKDKIHLVILAKEEAYRICQKTQVMSDQIKEIVEDIPVFINSSRKEE